MVGAATYRAVIEVSKVLEAPSKPEMTQAAINVTGREIRDLLEGGEFKIVDWFLSRMEFLEKGEQKGEPEPAD